jgi:hypothetical protein
LANRWHQRQRVDPALTLIDHVTGYCRLFGSDSQQARRPWLLELSYDGDARPDHWPRNLDWSKYAGFWRATMQRVADWELGKLTTPCVNASHWGSLQAGDHPKPGMRLLGCSGQARVFANQFYSLTSRKM